MEKKIVIATKNQGKVKEFAKAFSALSVKIVPLSDFGNLPDAIEDGNSFRENALIKAHFYAEKTKLPCLADDSGLVVDILNGEPGVYSARYAGDKAGDAANNEKLVQKIKEKGALKTPARFCCALAYCDFSGNELVTEGLCEGEVHLMARGAAGFGYDPYFYPQGQGEKSMAELSLEEKNAISHRGRALQQMFKLLLPKYQKEAK